MIRELRIAEVINLDLIRRQGEGLRSRGSEESRNNAEHPQSFREFHDWSLFLLVTPNLSSKGRIGQASV